MTVVPSECYENNPLSAIESLSAGTPVLGADIGGIPELITPSTGMLFEPADRHALAGPSEVCSSAHSTTRPSRPRQWSDSHPKNISTSSRICYDTHSCPYIIYPHSRSHRHCGRPIGGRHPKRTCLRPLPLCEQPRRSALRTRRATAQQYARRAMGAHLGRGSRGGCGRYRPPRRHRRLRHRPL